MLTIREIIATLIAAAALAALTLAVTGQPPAQAVSVHHSAGRTCDWHRVHRLDRYTTWQYVTPDLARYEHVGPCSKVVVGQSQSVIIGQDGHVADVS
jgi:hypothetical protein